MVTIRYLIKTLHNMRILFLTNFYPPHELGGQGRSCQSVVEALLDRGHQGIVLTSRHGSSQENSEDGLVYRWLFLEMELAPWRNFFSFYQWKSREAQNLEYFEILIEKLDPDIIFVWGMWNLPRSLPEYAEKRLPGKVIYRFADYWPILPSQLELYWREPGRHWFSEMAKRSLRPHVLSQLTKEDSYPKCRFEHAYCISNAAKKKLLDEGVPINNAQIIYNGIDVSLYIDGKANDCGVKSNKKWLLGFVGRLSPEKGVDLAIEALGKLVFDYGLNDLNLDIVGAGHEDYEQYLRRSVLNLGLESHVSFVGKALPKQMPAIYRQFDLLLFPSTWEEPFGLVVLEAMVSGVVVIASDEGGPAEIITNNENGVLFSRGDADDLAAKTALVISNDHLFSHIAEAGPQLVMKRFNLNRMIDDIESFLYQIFKSETLD